MQFYFNGHLYELTFDAKPFLKEDGIEISNKTLSILREYINANNINISFVNGQGNPKNTHVIVKELLKVHTIQNVKKAIKKTKEINTIKPFEKPDSILDFDLSISSNIVYLANCSSAKIKADFLEDKPFDVENLHFHNHLGEYRKHLLTLINSGIKIVRKKSGKRFDVKNNFSMSMSAPAYKIYSKGRFFTPANSILWKKVDAKRVYILSALFGIIRADDYLPLYDFAMSDTVDGDVNFAKNYWNNKLNIILRELVDSNCVIVNLMSDNYNSIIDVTLTNKPKLNFNKNDRNVRTKKRGEWLRSQLGC